MICRDDDPLLTDEVRSYSTYRNLAARSAYQLDRTVRLLGEWLVRPAVASDLTDERVSEWLVALEPSHSQRTIAGHRVNIMTIWKDMAWRHLVAPPFRVRMVSKPEPCPISWTLDELRAVVEACRAVQGSLKDGTPRAIYFEALTKAAYDTGLRRSDLWSITHEQIRVDGTIVMRQQKTGRPHNPRLTPPTLALIRQLRRDPPLKWTDSHERCFYVQWDRITSWARVRDGALQQIRRTGATHLYKDHPEAVQRYLGHRSPSMQRHYVDMSIACPQAHLPPSLD